MILERKPQILCLHGLGSSAEIFKAQTYHLRYHLEDHFEFVYIDGPYECGPGPGILPTFEGCGPFYRWTKEHEDAYDQNAYDHSGSDRSAGVYSALAKLTPSISSELWVGVMGFSQGGRVASGLLKHQSFQLAQEDGSTQEGLGMMQSQFKFGVFIHSAYPPLEFPRATDPAYKDHVIDIATLHIHGLRDKSLEIQRRLVSCFTGAGRTHLEFDVGHVIPAKEGDIKAITEHIVSLKHVIN
ncbi:hypothetical protein IG631_24291 [Alternaria alternata]|nr:hypothetical protein IG631_24291 [Alternaria alternata]